jgi:hypothetical protein
LKDISNNWWKCSRNNPPRAILPPNEEAVRKTF